MSETFIPDTLEGVNPLLLGEWETAAFVWAYVHCYEDANRPGSAKTSSSEKSYTPTTFAKKRLLGLCSKDTVRAYWQRWQDAIDSDHAVPVKPGDPIPTVALPWKVEKATAKQPAPQPKPKTPPKAKEHKPSQSDLIDDYLKTLIEDGYMHTMNEQGREKLTGMVESATGIKRSHGTLEQHWDRLGGATSRQKKVGQDGDIDIPPIAWDTIPASSQAMINSEVKKRYTKLAEELQAEQAKATSKRVEALVGMERKSLRSREIRAKYILDGHKGLMPLSDYRLLLSCVHPDSRESASDEKLAEAFRILNDPKVKAVLVKE